MDLEITFFDKIMNLIVKTYFIPIASFIWGIIFLLDLFIYHFADKSVPSLVDASGFNNPATILINIAASMYMGIGYLIGTIQLQKFHYFGNEGIDRDGMPSKELSLWALNSPLYDIFSVQYGSFPLPKAIRKITGFDLSQNSKEVEDRKNIIIGCYIYSRYGRLLMKRKYWLLFALPLGLAGFSYHAFSFFYYIFFDNSVIHYSILNSISSFFIGPGYLFMPFTLAWLVAFTISFKELLHIGTNWTNVEFNADKQKFFLKNTDSDQGIPIDEDTNITVLKNFVEAYANNSILNLRKATKPIATTYFQFSLIIILAGFIFGMFLGSNPKFWFVGLIPAIIASVLGLLVFLLPQYYIYRVISTQKTLLLSIIEYFYQLRLNLFLKYHNKQQKLIEPEELNLLASASDRVNTILEWPFDYSVFTALVASAIFPIFSLILGQIIKFE